MVDDNPDKVMDEEVIKHGKPTSLKLLFMPGFLFLMIGNLWYAGVFLANPLSGFLALLPLTPVFYLALYTAKGTPTGLKTGSGMNIIDNKSLGQLRLFTKITLVLWIIAILTFLLVLINPQSTQVWSCGGGGGKASPQGSCGIGTINASDATFIFSIKLFFAVCSVLLGASALRLKQST